MKYLINNDTKDIVDRILDINHVRLEDLDVSNFFVDYNNQLLIDFKEKLLQNQNDKFLIVGDYDCDGICATAIMKKLLTDMNIEHNYYIPSRSNEGYGVNMKIVQTAVDNNFNALLLLDNGVSAEEEIAYAKKNHIKVYIIDHHEYVDVPDVDGFLHPNLFDSAYSDMCAGGLSALFSNSIREDDLTIVLGGLATLADMVSVFDYNRYLMKKMIEILNTKNVYQINLLAKTKTYDYDKLSFDVIPKINAVSRLDEFLNVNMVVKYLLADEDYCLKNVVAINKINDARKELSKNESIIASSMFDETKNINVLVSSEFKEGLCGLIANKLLTQYHKPVIVLSIKDDLLVGSCRSIPGFNIYEYLKKCEGIFEAFGGHALAVGLSIRKDNLEILNKYIETHPIEIEEVSEDVLLIDSKEVDFELFNCINSLKPFGTNFKEPLFMINGVNYKRKFIVGNKYPKYYVNEICDAISFNSNNIDKQFESIIGKIKKDEYHNNKLSILIEDLL